MSFLNKKSAHGVIALLLTTSFANAQSLQNQGLASGAPSQSERPKEIANPGPPLFMGNMPAPVPKGPSQDTNPCLDLVKNYSPNNSDTEDLCIKLDDKGISFTDGAQMEGLKKSLSTLAGPFLILEIGKHYDSGYVRALIRDLKALKGQKIEKAADTNRIRIAAEVNMHYRTGLKNKFGYTTIGGLSGLTYDRTAKKFYMISDDKNYHDIFSLDVNPGAGSFMDARGMLLGQLELRGVKTSGFFGSSNERINQGDNEEIVKLPDGRFIISREDADKPLTIFSDSGEELGNLQVPVDFVKKYEKKTEQRICADGQMRHVELDENGVIVKEEVDFWGNPKPKKQQAFSWSDFNSDGKDKNGDGKPDGDKKDSKGDGTAVAGTGAGLGGENTQPKQPEKPKTVRKELMGPPKMCMFTNDVQVGGLDFNKGIEAMTVVPGSDFLIFANEGPLPMDAAVSKRTIRIYVDQVAHMMTAPPEKFFKYRLDEMNDNGMSGMAALDNRRLITIERGFDSAKREGIIRLYLVKLDQLDKDGVLKKTLLVDFKDLRGQMAPGMKKIDNFEGITIGETVGTSTLVHMVSDDNFNADQRSVFLTLSIPNNMLD
jgi:hypothetical protein